MNISVNYSAFSTKGDLIPPKIDQGPTSTSPLAVQQLWIGQCKRFKKSWTSLL